MSRGSIKNHISTYEVWVRTLYTLPSLNFTLWDYMGMLLLSPDMNIRKQYSSLKIAQNIGKFRSVKCLWNTFSLFWNSERPPLILCILALLFIPFLDYQFFPLIIWISFLCLGGYKIHIEGQCYLLDHWIVIWSIMYMLNEYSREFWLLKLLRVRIIRNSFKNLQGHRLKIISSEKRSQEATKFLHGFKYVLSGDWS